MGQVWWHSTLILALWRQREVDLRLPGRPGESQDSQSYVERLYPHALQKKRKRRKEKGKIQHGARTRNQPEKLGVTRS